MSDASYAEHLPDNAARLAGLPLQQGRTALVIIDMQHLDADRHAGVGPVLLSSDEHGHAAAYFDRVENVVIPALASVLAACRAAAIPVAHVRTASPALGSGELSWRYRTLGFGCDRDSLEASIVDELTPATGEAVIDKITSSAFVGTVLDVWLRAARIETIIVGGVVTNGCVESSVRHGADLGYGVWMLEDGCAALSPSEHAASLAQLHGNFARVVSAATAVAAIG